MKPLSADSRDFVHLAAERSRGVEGTLGHALWRYAELEGLPDLAAVVTTISGKLDDDGIARLCLCRRPRGDGLAAGASAIAGKFGLERQKLIHVLRRVEGAEALAQGGASTLAARRESDAGKGDGR